jgi:hypothetical protein
MAKDKFVVRRNLSFFYLNENHVEEYKESVKNYLKEISEKVENIGEPYVAIDFYDSKPKTRARPTGHLFIYDIQDDLNKLEEICNFVLSNERKFIPIEVDCSKKEDYGMIENILKKNYGDKGRLTNGFLGISGLFGMKSIKKK